MYSLVKYFIIVKHVFSRSPIGYSCLALVFTCGVTTIGVIGRELEVLPCLHSFLKGASVAQAYDKLHYIIGCIQFL